MKENSSIFSDKRTVTKYSVRVVRPDRIFQIYLVRPDHFRTRTKQSERLPPLRVTESVVELEYSHHLHMTLGKSVELLLQIKTLNSIQTKIA